MLANLTRSFCNIILSTKNVLEGLTRSIHELKKKYIFAYIEKNVVTSLLHIYYFFYSLFRTSRYTHSTLIFGDIEYKKIGGILLVPSFKQIFCPVSCSPLWLPLPAMASNLLEPGKLRIIQTFLHIFPWSPLLVNPACKTVFVI